MAKSRDWEAMNNETTTDPACERIVELEDMLFSMGAMETPPCFVCGYNGAGYYQPSKHKCAERHHKMREEE